VQLSVRLVTRPGPGIWPRILVTVVVIVIVAAAAWAGYGPPGVIALFAGGGVLAQLGQGRGMVPVPEKSR
jgi:hypothetical protein